MHLVVALRYASAEEEFALGIGQLCAITLACRPHKIYLNCLGLHVD
jgi:hypothetical protein